MIKFTDEIMTRWIDDLPQLKEAIRSTETLSIGQRLAIGAILVALESAIERIQKTELLIKTLRENSVPDSELNSAP